MKKTLAWLLTLFMVLTISSVTVFAAETTPAGNDFTGYTSADAIWGEVWGNATESFVIKVLDANGNVMGTTSLNDIDGIIDGDVNVTWNIKLDAASNTDEYWTMSWTTAPSVDNMPAKVELWVDGVKVSGGNVVLNGPDSIGTIVAAVGDSNGKILSYATAADMQTAVAVDGAKTILMLNDVTLADGLALPAGVTLNGNGKTINGTIAADGDLTIAGVTKVAGFSAGWYNHTITIGPGASLEITGGGRTTLGYGNIFNITGSIVDAKTVDLNTVVPSLKLPAGISITGGNGAALNVKNAYIEAGLTSSKPGVTNGTFDINLTNSVAVFTGKFALDTSTGGMTPVFNTSLKDSVLNVAGNLVFGNTGCNTTIDNSVVNANSSFRNDGSLNLINGSVLNVAAMIQAGENGGNSGTIVVDNSTLDIDCSTAGHAMDGKGTGKLVVVNGGAADVGYITDTDVEADLTSSLTSEALLGNFTVTIDASNFNGTSASVLNLGTKLDENVVMITGTGAADVEVTDDGEVKVVVNTPDKAFDGKGTEANPYLINGLDDLLAFRILVNSGNDFAGKTVQLTANIDLAGIEWTPIGNNAKQFKGYFDGNNKTISNLTVTGKNDYAGLFGYIKGNSMAATATPTVKNLNLTGVNVSGDYYVGALSGQGYTCSVVNVHVQGTVTGTRYVGGLIGHVYTYFKDCSFTGNASCTFDALGGIAGAGDCRAYDCKVVGDITGSNWVGGIVGNGQEGTSAVGCYVKGTVSTNSNYYRGVGGIAGVAGHGYSNSEFKNNYFDGEVYLCGEKVDAIIMGIVNADNNDSIGTTVEGNSWNTEYYPATTPVYVVAEISSSTATAEEWIAGASEEKSDVRNNNLVMLESDLAYIDAEDADDVTIMQFSDVTEGEVAHAVIVNKSAASITDSNGVTTYYDTLEEALKAVTDGCTLEILSDITIASDWDNRTTGAKIAVPVTIDGNGYTLKFTGMITDGYNYLSAFRFEAAATVKDLTIDLSEATSQWAPRLRAISAKTDITIDNCTFIGNAAYNNTNAVIIGEGAGAAMGDVVITITNSTFTNWRNGISDNQNGQDAKTVTVTGNTFNNANARIAAKNSVVFNNNTMNNGGVTIASFTTPASLAVTAKENTLATGDAIVNEIKNANTIDVQSGFTGAVASVNGTIYGSLEAAFAAAQSGNTVVLLDNVNAAVTYAVNKTLTLDLNGYTIESDAAATLTATAGGLTIVDSSADQTGAIIGAKAIHSSAYVAIQSGKFVGTITTANNQADDSQVCITGGNFSVEPNANIIKHTYIAVLAEDETYNVIPDKYEVIINGNGGTVAGEGFYEYGDIVYISAGTNGNYVFAGWLSDDVVIQNADSRDAFFVMPDHSVTVSGYWASSGVSTPVYPVLRGTLHFETNGGTAIDSISGTYGAKVDLAQYVTIRQGYTFAGWYSDAALSKPVTQITMGGTKTVYAGWIETPVIPDIPVVTLPFTDVAADAYYYNAVLWAVAKDITNGISDTAFGPDMVCTRAQVVTFLWRAAGCPVAAGNDMPFTDVSRDAYYYDAVLWAVEQGITNGISDTEFGADDECTRAQIVTFLWRSQGSPEAAADGNFSDVDADAYYATAVEWAVDNGVTNGVGDDAFAPDAECTRAQTVTFLYRYFVK